MSLSFFLSLSLSPSLSLSRSHSLPFSRGVFGVGVGLDGVGCVRVRVLSLPDLDVCMYASSGTANTPEQRQAFTFLYNDTSVHGIGVN